MSETKTLREQALENLGVNTPSWIIEAAESLAESYVSPLRERISELEHKITFAKACLDRIGCLDFGTIHEGIAMEGLDKLINEGGK